MNTQRHTLMTRDKIFVNTDPQRRCYDGAYYSYRYDWSAWEVLESRIPAEKVEAKLKFWTELNDYAVSCRGEGAKREFKTIPEETT